MSPVLNLFCSGHVDTFPQFTRIKIYCFDLISYCNGNFLQLIIKKLFIQEYVGSSFPYHPCKKMGKKVAKPPSKPSVKKQVKGPSKTFGAPAKSVNSHSSNKSKKNVRVVSSDSETESSSSDSEIEIKFELFNMAEDDYHSIKQYLGNSFGAGDHGVDLVGLTSFIVESLADHLGTCIKTDGESSDPFGFLTAFPVSFAQKESLKSFETFLTSKSPEIKEFFADGRNVVLFQERLINVPGSIAAPLFRQFLDDWELAAGEVPSHFAKPENVLIITPTYKEIVSKLDRELGLQENPAKFGVASTDTNFYYEEMEFIGEFASKYFDFSVNTGHETSDSRRAFTDHGIEPGRRAFIISWEKLGAFVKHLESLQ